VFYKDIFDFDDDEVIAELKRYYDHILLSDKFFKNFCDVDTRIGNDILHFLENIEKAEILMRTGRTTQFLQNLSHGTMRQYDQDKLIVSCALGFAIGILFAVLIPQFGYFIAPQIVDNQKLNDCFHILDKTVIYEAGKTEIENIVSQTSQLGTDPKRLTIIADLIIQNFTDPNWQYQQNEKYFCYYPNDKIRYNYCLLQGDKIKSIYGQSLLNATYMFDKLGHVRQYGGTDLSTDPYWIAFQKTGECQELSVLFNRTANESGFVTRIVRSSGIGHWWNEVNIDGEWKFFDVQRYGEMKTTNNSITYWFGNTSDYANWTGFPLSNITKSGVCVYNIQTNSDGEDVTGQYDPKKLSSHGICSLQIE